MSATKVCCYCLKRPAKIYGGHVTRGKVKIIAGWCERHVPDDATESTKHARGWCGHWVRAMGARQRIEVAARNMRDEYRLTYEAELSAHRATAAKLAKARLLISQYARHAYACEQFNTRPNWCTCELLQELASLDPPEAAEKKEK